MTDVRIALVTGVEHGVSLTNEIRLVKPALLYADHVTLYSPVATLLRAGSVVGSNDDLTFEVARQVGDVLDPTFPSTIASYDAIVAKKHKTRQELQALIGVRKAVKKAALDVLRRMEQFVEEAGGHELVPALDAGLLTIHPLLVDEESSREVAAIAYAVRLAAQRQAGAEVASDPDTLFDNFMARLWELLGGSHAYPLFDDQIGSVLRDAVATRAIELRAGPVRRAKQVSTASRLMEELPAFPHATVQEILDIRDELRSPLIRFRAAVIEIERLIQSPAHGEDFAAEVEDMYREKVAPALLELNELIADNTWLTQLRGAVVDDAKSILAAAGVTAGVTTTLDLPLIVAAAFDVAAPTAAAIARASKVKAAKDHEIARHQLFFLHRANVLLAAR